MRRLGIVFSLVTLVVSSTSWAFITPFGQRVDEVISRGLEHFRQTQNADGGWGGATGLVTLCFLEQRLSADWNAPSRGYVGMPPEDQERIRNSIRYCIDNVGGFGNGPANAYKAGACLMSLSLYIGTGGPNDVGASRGVLEAIELGVDNIKNAQGNCGTNIGGWHYIDRDNGECQGDLSTTQFTMAGLSAAAAIFPTADATVNLVSTFLDNDTNNDGGNGYRPGQGSSHPMTASGAWAARLGRMPTASPQVQLALGWLNRNYRYDNNIIQKNGWNGGIYYHLWAASKAYEVTEDDGGGAALYSDDIGGVRDPVADGFGDETARWYYDFAWFLTQVEINAGQSGTWNGYDSWNNVARDAYSILVLERSLGGVCLLDSDGDGLCDVEDNCPDVPNPPMADTNNDGVVDDSDGQADQDNDGIGDVCDNCPNLPNGDQMDADGDEIGDACDDLICIIDGQNDVCDNIDNDCDGLIDEDAGSTAADGVPCATGQEGNCAIGDSICRMGMETCIPRFVEEMETCDGYDNDCDGTIDEGVRGACGLCATADVEICDGIDNDCDGEVDNDAECPDGQRCYEGECFEVCRINECLTANARCDEDSGLCLTGCTGIECALGEVCDEASGMCEDPCANGPDCGPGLRCWMGSCAPNDCTTTGCDHLENTSCRCPDSESNCQVKECLGDPCAAVDCSDPSECDQDNGGCFCRDGQCVGSCAAVSCGLNETCVDGECVCSIARNLSGECLPDPCNGVSCPEGQRCDSGACLGDPCQDIECAENQYCVSGTCVFDDCTNISCPLGQECIQTDNGKQCVYSDRPVSSVPEDINRMDMGSGAQLDGGTNFAGANEDAGVGPDGGGASSFVPTGTVDEAPTPEPISSCQCEQSLNDTPMRTIWLMVLFGMIAVRWRRQNN